MKVLLRAPLLSLSGYGIHSRQIFEWLETIPGIELTVEILQWGTTTWLVNESTQNGLIGRIMEKSRELQTPYDVTFQVQLPDEWDTKLGKINIGVSAYVETNKCSQKWLDATNKMDHIIVPSNFTKNVILKSGNVKPEISVVPEWFNQEIENNKKSKPKLHFNKKFNFLMIGTVTSRNPDDDRKNMLYGIKWFCETFKDNKNVGLILKTSFGKGTMIDRHLTLNTVKGVLKEVRKGDYPKVTVVHGNMTQKEIADLYKHSRVKCLISPTRGEGYGLPLVEAAASGLPVMATNWSGHLDFLEDKFIKIDYDLVNINKSRIDNRIFVEGTKWAMPNELQFKRKLKEVYENIEKFENNSKVLKKNVLKNFSKKSIIKIYDEVFEKIKIKNSIEG